MAAQIIDGKQVAADVRGEVAAGVTQFIAEHGSPPGLATVLVGDDPASDVYVSGKQKACAEVGIAGFDHRLPADTSQAEIAALIERLNGDARVSGVLLQLPVPAGLDADELTELIDPGKDVDGLTAVSIGRLALGQDGLRPCTPTGVMVLLERYGIELEGASAVVLGRSQLVGKPVAQLLLAENATVTVCHSRTRDLAAVCASADVLVAAVGQPELVRGDFIREGAVVIDVGINRVDGKLVGDVDFAAASERASYITPVPGGVGPMTVACLLQNTLQAARMQASGS